MGLQRLSSLRFKSGRFTLFRRGCRTSRLIFPTFQHSTRGILVEGSINAEEKAKKKRKDGSVGNAYQRVAANFRCACGGCGELFMVDCTCDMPKGAVETKAFIRNKLGQGLSVDQVIQLVDKQYGHRIL